MKKEEAKASTREGKRQISAWFFIGVQKKVKQLALDEDTNVQSLLEEAINDLFIKRGKEPPIEPKNNP